MKRTFAILAAACIAGANLAAQTPSTDPAAAANKSGKSMTVTGCLSKGASDDAYALSSAAAPMTMSPNAAPGEAPAEHKSEKPKSNWALVAGGDVNFSALVGHTVEVTGSVVSDKKAENQPVGTSGQTDPTAVKKLNVTSIKDVSATCMP